jgi:hypothetical protein
MRTLGTVAGWPGATRWAGRIRVPRTLSRGQFALLAAVVLPLGVSALLTPFRSSFPNSDAALVLVVTVVAVAAVGYRPAGALAALSAGTWFDFFLTRPYEQLAIIRRADVETTVLLLVVGLAVTELAVRRRHHRTVVRRQREYLGYIQAVVDMTAEGVPDDVLVRGVAGELTELLQLQECRFESDPAEGGAPRIDRNGDVVWVGVGWEAGRAGMPDCPVQLPVRCRGRDFGRFVLTPGYRLPVPVERRVVAAILADLVGAAMAGRVPAQRAVGAAETGPRSAPDQPAHPRTSPPRVGWPYVADEFVNRVRDSQPAAEITDHAFDLQQRAGLDAGDPATPIEDEGHRAGVVHKRAR